MRNDAPEASPRRLSRAERRRQLLATALRIVREEGADRLTLGILASRAGVSKPVAYDHFATRTGLLIALYRSIDAGQVEALHAALREGPRDLPGTARILADAYLRCAADTHGDWQAVGAALAGSAEKDNAHRELLEGYVQLFAGALSSGADLRPDELERRCVGLIGAGEALAAAMLRGACTQKQAADAFAHIVEGALST